MDLKATLASGYRNRLILITAGGLLYAAWAFYDATVKYPAKQDQYEAYKETQEKYPKNWDAKWAERIEGTDWVEQPNEVTDMSIATQWILFGITFPVGALCLFSLIKWSRRYIGADDSKLYAHGGIEVPFDQIDSIDASRWENKGIARVKYDAGSGEQEVVIDDWKYQREPSDAIFARLREHVDAEKITGLNPSIETESESETPADDEALADSDAASQDEPTTTPSA